MSEHNNDQSIITRRVKVAYKTLTQAGRTLFRPCQDDVPRPSKNDLYEYKSKPSDQTE